MVVKIEIYNQMERCFDIDGNAAVRDDGIVDVDGSVRMISGASTSIPVKFGRVTGQFYCSYTSITSLEGCPDWVGGIFACGVTHITSLQGSPRYVGGQMFCNDTAIENLQGGPEFIGGGIIFFTTPFSHKFYNDPDTQLAAVQQYPQMLYSLLHYNHNPSQSVQLAAISKQPTLIEFIENPTRLIQLTAVKADPDVYELIENPDPMITQYMRRQR